MHTAPSDGPGLSNRGVEFASDGNLDDALADFSRAIQLGPPRAEYFNNRGVVYASRGELEQATADFDEAIRIDPEFTLAYANRAIVCARLGQVDLALEDVSTLVQFDWGETARALRPLSCKRERGPERKRERGPDFSHGSRLTTTTANRCVAFVTRHPN